MTQLEVTDAGILYITPDPAHEHVFASHPHPLQLTEQEFICTCQCGHALYAVDAHVRLLRSKDGGVTWVDEGSIYDRSRDDRSYSYHDGFISRLRDGSVVVLAFRADRSVPRKPMFAEKGGLIESEPVLFLSRDGGLTWTHPWVVRLPAGIRATPANPIIELDDGRWLATFDQWPRYDDPGLYKPRMVAFSSNDNGQTWEGLPVMADGWTGEKGFWHGKTLLLADGRLFTTFWAADLTDEAKGPVDLPMHISFTDQPATCWPDPASTTVPAQTHWPTQLPDGRLALIYTVRAEPRPGIKVTLAVDDGRNWDLATEVQLWDATGWTHVGIDAPDRYPHSHDTIAFGAPSLMTTLDGDLYASWWCTYASLTHIRWARLRIVA